MKRSRAIPLRTAIVLIGMGAFAFLLWEPHLEGRNAHATLSQIYFHDPFLLYVYLASIPFFVMLYQAFRMVGSQEVKHALRTIKYCAILLIGFVAGGEAVIISNESDDRTGGVFMGVLIGFASLVIAVVAAKCERTRSIN